MTNRSPRVHALAPQFELAHPRRHQQLHADAYRAMVRRGIEYIHAGDVFQVNLAQRLLRPADAAASRSLSAAARAQPGPFRRLLRPRRPSQIASASPECFLTVRDGRSKRGRSRAPAAARPRPEADLFAGDELRASEKDRAENVMIVDLLRNDLSRVCRADTVHVVAALPPGNLRLRAAPGVGRSRRRCAPELTPARSAAGKLSRRLGHRRPESPGHGDHRRARADRPRPVLRLAGLHRL